MKKIIILVLSVSIALSLLFQLGCAPADNPTDPGPTPTIYVFAGGETVTIDDFEDCNISGMFGNITLITDESEGGNTEVVSFGAVSGGYNGSSCALGITVTAEPNLSAPYSAQAPCTYEHGYLLINIPMASGGADITDAINCGFQARLIGNYASIRYRFIVYGKKGRFAESAYSYTPTNWTNIGFEDGNLSVPSGATYTVEDVLGEVTKVVINLDIQQCTGTVAPINFNLFIDDIELFDGPC